jgi:hypothetical protein
MRRAMEASHEQRFYAPMLSAAGDRIPHGAIYYV